MGKEVNSLRDKSWHQPTVSAMQPGREHRKADFALSVWASQNGNSAFACCLICHELHAIDRVRSVRTSDA
jgi:hypothetical protein